MSPLPILPPQRPLPPAECARQGWGLGRKSRKLAFILGLNRVLYFCQQKNPQYFYSYLTPVSLYISADHEGRGERVMISGHLLKGQ